MARQRDCAPTGQTVEARGFFGAADYTRNRSGAQRDAQALDLARRCTACGDPCRPGWAYCPACHAWNDLAQSLRLAAVGLDQQRLHRARAHFARRSADPVEALLRKLTRRVASLELRLSL